jgi:hypothetical protein
LWVASQAHAGFYGKMVSANYLYPISGIQFASGSKVAGPGVEFNGVGSSDAIIDFRDNGFRITYPTGWTIGAAATTAMWMISSPSGQLGFTGASLVSTTIPGLTASRISFDPWYLYIDHRGLTSFPPGSYVDIDVTMTEPPDCTVTANTASPVVNATLTLTASCTNSPTMYYWKNCESISSTCTASSSSPGTRSYTVTAENAGGTSHPVTINLFWRADGGLDGCVATVNGASSTLLSPTGGSVSLQVTGCEPGGAFSYTWSRNGTAGASNAATWTDTPASNPSLAANHTGNFALTSYLVKVCADNASPAYCITLPGPAPRGTAAPLTALVPPATVPSPALVTVLEFYNAGLDHYFISWKPDEIVKLVEGKALQGWRLTGNSFTAYNVAQNGASSVCRYHIPPAAGDSHFYGRGTTECNATGQAHPTFVLEDANFMTMLLPAAGSCPSGTKPVYRVFSDRADANHRYLTDKSLRTQMAILGWTLEGEGLDLVVMCAPSTPPTEPPKVPQCSGLSASNLAPQAGTSITLSACCTNNPTSYTWTNCTSITSACTATRTTPGNVTYELVASNAAGSSPPVSISVNWLPNETPVPVCALVSSNATPRVGQPITITANCTNNPTSYTWAAGCVPSGSTCSDTNATAGLKTYSVVARNAAGAGPSSSIPVTWQQNPPECSPSQTPVGTLPIGARVTLSANCTNDPIAWRWTLDNNTVGESSILDVPSVTATSTYRVVATNAAGSSSPAGITVQVSGGGSEP